MSDHQTGERKPSVDAVDGGDALAMQSGRMSTICAVLVVVASTALAGCSFGALPTSTGDVPGSTGSLGEASRAYDDGEFHSTTCGGLQIERHEHAARLESLENSIKAQIEAAPGTMAQLLARISTEPEKGTASYHDAELERARLKATDAAAANLHCPTGAPTVAAVATASKP